MKKQREGNRLFKIQEIAEKQLVFSLDIFTNEIEEEINFYSRSERTWTCHFSPCCGKTPQNPSSPRNWLGSLWAHHLLPWNLRVKWIYKTLSPSYSKWDKRHVNLLIQ